ncbi:MAG: hypothetical protein Alis3KO_10050 [Aliiglaciecola sp.]
MNEFEKSAEKDVATVNKRRSFIKKTATGAVIASLPAKSVWGACSVSGAMSGNLSQNTDRHDCHMPNFSNGRSPGAWGKVMGYNGNNRGNTVKSMFIPLNDIMSDNSLSRNQKRNARECYLEEIESRANDLLSLPAELISNPITVGDALQSQGGTLNNIQYHLAAVYLNAYYGFYAGYQGRADALNAIEQVYLYWYMANKSGTVSISDNDLGYDDGRTYWELNSCSVN